MRWYLAALKSYAAFSGRARRKEYWLFALIDAGFTIGLMLIESGPGGSALGFGPMTALYTFATVIPGWAVSVRRLHDTGHAGGLLLLCFVPFGAFVLLAFLTRDGTPGPNAYGRDPKEADRRASVGALGMS